MTELETFRKGWRLIDPKDRRAAIGLLMVMIVSALLAAGSVGSVLPFLAVLSDPSRIHSVAPLSAIYDGFGFTSTYTFVRFLGLLVLGTIIVSNAVQLASIFLMGRFARLQMHKLSHRLLGCYLTQPYEFFVEHHSSDLAATLLAESREVVSQFLLPAASIFAAATTVICVTAVLLLVNPVVAVLAFLGFGSAYALTFLTIRAFMRRVGARRNEANRQTFRIASEALSGIKDVKVLMREQSYYLRFGKPSEELAKARMVQALLSELPSYVLRTLAFCGLILLCLAIMDPETLDGGNPLSGIFPFIGVFALAAQRLIPEIHRLYTSLASLNFGASVVSRVHATLTEMPPISLQNGGAQKAMGLNNSLRLEKLCYSYPNAAKPGLTDLSLKIRAGERFGIVGSTGAGKTTLVDLLLGLFRPTSGQIVVDGIALDDSNMKSWMLGVGYVPQEIFLIDATIAENIAFGIAPDQIDMTRVRAAAQIAQIDRYIEDELPEGFLSRVGERGVRLSGGQRQRIGIARALYRDVDLIVFDEATSALDNLTEREVMNAIEELSGDQTIIVIAHRLSTVRFCDRIAVIEAGRLAGVGTWDELLGSNPVFARLHESGQSETDAKPSAQGQ